MNKREQNNFLKRLSQINQNEGHSTKQIEKLTFMISLFAIVISCITLYFQFFYEKNDLRANFISADFKNDSTLISTIVFHNKGNTYSTVLGNTIVFYQDTTNIENTCFEFDSMRRAQDYSENFEPFVLVPGQQIHKDIHQSFDFTKLNFAAFKINPKLKIKLALAISYINKYGFYSTSFIPVGWVQINSFFQIEDFSVEYRSETLSSDTYYSGMYKGK